ncbi:helicase-like protein [Sarocladium implicatum]|nr:helicase-like protein [Sarocladium implicatum]
MSPSWLRRRTSMPPRHESPAEDQPQFRHHNLETPRVQDSPQDEATPRTSPSASKLIQGFLERTRTRRKRGTLSGSGAGSADGSAYKRPDLRDSARSSPTHIKPPPRSPPDPNKPLPPPPIDSDLGEPSSARHGRPVLKLDKIMATLTEDDIEKLFSGAPHFYCRAESHFSGAPHPCVAFPFDEELEIRDLTDRVPIDDKAWSGVSAWPHLTRDVRRDVEGKRQAEKERKAHFHIKARERPNMLSMQGGEKGTMGFEAALELPVGDSLNEEQFGFGSIGTKAKAIIEARESMLSDKGWLRRLPESDVLDRLLHNGNLYRNNDLKTRSTEGTYNELFHSLLRPAHVQPIDKQDPHGLANQIDCLLKCLGMPNVWIDLSLVEWRIRLGQILWGRVDGDELDDATDISDAHDSSEREDERFWLLMQVLVATELLIRLDAVTEGQEFGSGGLRQIDVVRFERAATPAVKWSLFLARSWLENIEVVREEARQQKAPAQIPTPVHHHGGWLSSLVSKVSLYYHHEHESKPPTSSYNYTIRGRNGERQVHGLLHFAKKLRWPGLESYEERITSNVEHAMDKTPTPMPTSNTMDSSQSYFGAWDITGNGTKKNGRVQAQRRKVAAALHASGWLSKSYVFGLLLPGEALSHFLMATLIENDLEAISRLGSFANLCGGFVYSDMSFWSTSCIVGRVLAAANGAAECMGWISTEIVPIGKRDGWLNICTQDVAADMAQIGRKSRIWAKKKLERESSILGDADEDSVFPADFTIPHEDKYSKQPPTVTTDLSAFKLLESHESVVPTPYSELTPMPTPATSGSVAPELASHPAALTFAVSMNGQKAEEYTFNLTYDISFVTAHPCAPSSRVRLLKSPTSPTIQQIDVSGSDMLGNTSRSVHRAGHPLHKSYNYNIVHISELLQRRHYFLEDFLPAPLPTTKPASRANTTRVVVIDCMTNMLDAPPPSPLFERSAPTSPVLQRSNSISSASMQSRRKNIGSDMEVLARALCAQNGWNAIISRRRRGCLACAVREAGALGWAVIVRVP